MKSPSTTLRASYVHPTCDRDPRKKGRKKEGKRPLFFTLGPKLLFGGYRRKRGLGKEDGRGGGDKLIHVTLKSGEKPRRRSAVGGMARCRGEKKVFFPLPFFSLPLPTQRSFIPTPPLRRYTTCFPGPESNTAFRGTWAEKFLSHRPCCSVLIIR